ncbi:hypothetical protein Poli38472_010018 [Pythium oligandrum]|uniref:Uncharacterized protein n=1 Tax=Pythium oligandrum TaxID=41045 RepID=A0A8K1C8K6_PYTOL|nr:hypothetical protein Poli38472_010018 [Pythium oligandrum]|eukprot:TMW58459.1 hypothetical protein Poli38472_010018 [Pythium oligandrum]
MRVDTAYVNQDLVAPVHPVVAIDKRLCLDRTISMLIPQDILHHPNHSAIHEVGKQGFGPKIDAHKPKKVGVMDKLKKKLSGNHDAQPVGVQPAAGVHQPASHGVGQHEVRQNELTHNPMHQPGHGVAGHNMPGQDNKGPLLFDFANAGVKDKDDRVLKDSFGTPIVYLTEKNRVIQRNFVVTRDSHGDDKIFDVSRKHLSKSPVRAQFKDLASGRTCRLGAAVLEEAHGITALLWLDVGDGLKQKLPVGRIHLPTRSLMHPNVTHSTDNHHKVTDAVRPVHNHHKDHDAYGKDYQLDLMPGVDSGLAALVGIVTIACVDHKRRSSSGDATVSHNITY